MYESFGKQDVIVIEEPDRLPRNVFGVQRTRRGPPDHFLQHGVVDLGVVRVRKGPCKHPPERVYHEEGAEEQNDVSENIADELRTLLACIVHLG